tara:strand:- start:1760 stop:2038 length:279 start_codon:yes stop_codon:yes gene_type:complete
MRTMKEIKELTFADLELYYFLQKSFNELQKFVDLIKGREKDNAGYQYGRYYLLSHSERKVVDGIINRAKKATHHDNVYAAITIVSESLTGTE